MIIAVGMFLVNALCALVPCHPTYEPPKPVPLYVSSHPPEETGFSGSAITRSVYRPRPNFRHNSRPYHIRNVAPVSVTSTPPPHVPSISASVKIPILKSPYVVATQSGKVEGFPMKTIRSRDIVAFTGIPYAEKPIGELRYREPIPKKPWSGVLKATTFASDCLQIDGMQLLRIVGSIDCLYLNVYTPELPSADTMRSLQVIVFIHGGSFAFGSGSMYGPSYLLDRDVVLVTFNYRLSSFGFLSTGDDAASGNWGLKDQRLVLQWVQANIASFGGDPNNVSLLGQSAGGVSVHLHMMSRESQGLFRAGISHSGNAFCFWGVRQSSVDFTYRLANSLRCPTNDSNVLVECMRKLDPNLIAYHEATLPEYKVFPGVFFGPIVEPDLPNAFLTNRPEKLYELNMVSKVPWINGFLVGEGNGVSFLTWLYPFVMREVDSRWSELGPKILDIKGNTRDISKAAAYIRNFYFGNQPINFDSRARLAQMVGDRLIVSAIYKGLRYHSKVAPTFGYFFNFTGRIGTAAIYGLKNDDWGISHDDDLVYLFNSTTYQALTVGDPEYRFSEFLVNLWTNFGKLGEPVFITENGVKVPFWNPVDSSPSKEIQVVTLDGKIPKMIDIPFRNRIRFWEKLDLVSNSNLKEFPSKMQESANKNQKSLAYNNTKGTAP